MLRVNKSLKLVIPVESTDGGPKQYIYSTPIVTETFERFYMPICKVFEAIYARGIPRFGAGVAYFMLKDAATQLGMWDVPEGTPAQEAAAQKPFTVVHGLLPEMKRLSLLYVFRNGAHEPLMLDDAVREGFLDQEDMREVLNVLIFFTVLYCMHQRGEREVLISAALRMWDASTTSLGFTEYSASLATSTKAADTGKKETPPTPPAAPPTSYVPS